MAVKLSNNASSTLVSSITSSATSLSVQSVDAGKFPTLAEGEWHPATIVDASNNMEIVKVTGRSGTTLTIVRAQEGTTAKEFAAGSRVEVRFTAAVVTSLQYDLAASEQATSNALSLKANNTDLTSLGNTVSGHATTLSNHATSIANKLDKSGGTMTGPLLLTDADAWRYRCRIGDYYCADTSITGVDIPPSGTDGPVFIQLTAGLTGAGGFNAGKLKNETVSGSSPLVLASAVIDFSGSPMDGQIVRLLNTEGRIIRPSTSAGHLQNDAFQGHKHYGNDLSIVSGTAAPNVGGGGSYTRTIYSETDGTISGSYGSPRVSMETRVKNIGETWYRRIA